MRNILLLGFFLLLYILSFVTEPVSDTIDVIAGATNETYSVTVDDIAGVSSDDHHDDDLYHIIEGEEE
jgi:hypothetical protein